MDAQILNELKNLNATMANLSNNSLANGGDLNENRQKTADERAAAQRMAKLEGDREKSLKEFQRIYEQTSRSITDMSTASQITASAFQDALAGTDISNLDTKFVDTFRNALEGSSNSIVSAMSSGLSDATDVVALEMQVASRNAFVHLYKSFEDGSIQLDEFMRRAEQAGLSAEQMDDYLTAAADNFEELEQNTLDLSHAMNAASADMIQSNRSLGETTERLRGRLGTLGTLAMGAGKELYEVANAAAKFGAGFSLVESRLLGMTPVGLAELQAEHKQAIMATSQSYSQFNSVIGTNSIEMRKYTGSLEDVSRLNAALVTDFTQLGGSIAGQTKYVEEQQERFKVWNKVFSMTSDEFVKFNAEMINSNGMQARLFKMDKSQYVQAQKQLMLTTEELKLQGLTIEEAKGVINTLNELSGTMDPKEMYKQSFQLEAYAASIGQGEAGKKAGALMRSGDMTSAEYIKEMEKINMASSAEQAESLTNAMVDFRNINARGLETLVGPNSPVGRLLVTREGAEIDGNPADLAKKMDVLPPLATDALAYADRMARFMEGKMYDAVKAAGIGGMVGGVMGGMGAAAAGTAAAGAALAAAPAVIATVLTGTLIKSVYDLVESNGQQSFAHDGAKWLSTAWDDLTGMGDLLKIEPPEPVEIDTIKEDAAILNELKKISQNSQEAMIHGMSQTELMKIAQKINQENKDALIQQTDIIDAYESHKKNQSRKTQRGGNRRRE